MNLEKLEEAINRISNGGAVCFLGAGFSIGGFDSNGDPIPDTQKLEAEIAALIDDDDEPGNFMELADFCESDPELKIKLRNLLVKRLTFTVPSPFQKKILQVPWRAVFTTNFDDIPETIIGEKYGQVIRPRDEVSKLEARKKPIYHLHGRARDFLEGEVSANIVLSETNFLDLKGANKDLHSALVNEVMNANQVVFIGYSLKDAEIARRIFSINESLKSKSIVITREGAKQRSIARLEKFGDVFPIGVQGFAARIPKGLTPQINRTSDRQLAFVNKITPTISSNEIKRENVDSMILTGDFNHNLFARQLAENKPEETYIVRRKKKVEKIFKSFSDGTNKFVVSSDIGNGKTTFLNELSVSAYERGYSVYNVDSKIGDTFDELIYLLGQDGLQLFIVDDLIRRRNIVEFIAKRLSGMSILVSGDGRGFEESYTGRMGQILNGAYGVVDLNVLDSEEISDWDSFLERWGLWGEQKSLTEHQRKDFLKNDCGSENRGIILSIFKRSRLAEKIDNIVNFFINRHPEHMLAFIGVLIASLCQKHVEWERVVDWLNINEIKFENDLKKSDVFDFLAGSKKWHDFTSSQLADHIFRQASSGKYNFDPDILIDVYTRIVRETAYSSNDLRSGYDSSENLKELLKFRFLTRIFGNDKNFRNIKAIYEKLSSIPRLRNNDQFYLQYAMACMELDDLDNASEYIQSALGIAKKRGLEYKNTQIVDQHIRLRLLINTKSKAGFNEKEMIDAIKDLREALKDVSVDERVYPLRSAMLLEDFIDKWIDDFTLEFRGHLTAIVKEMQSRLAEGKLTRVMRGEEAVIAKALRNCSIVLSNA